MRDGKIAAIAATASLLLVGVPTAMAATTQTTGTSPVITTIAGGPGGPALASNVALGGSTAFAASGGSGFVASENTIWRLNQATDMLSPFAGVATTGNDANGALARHATIALTGISGDPGGDLLDAQWSTNSVRLVANRTGTFFGQSMTSGHIYTIAGTGTKGLSGDGGPAVKAMLSMPRFVTSDAAGNAVIIDTGNNRIRVVAAASGRFYSRSMTAGDIYTVHTGTSVSAMTSVVADTAGNLVVDDSGGDVILVIAERTGTFYGQAMTAGKVYPILALTSALASPSIALDGTGNVLMTTFTQNGGTGTGLLQILAAASGTFYGQSMTAGKVYTIAGGGSSSASGVPALQASITPAGTGKDVAGNLVFFDLTNGGFLRVMAVSTGHFYGQAMTAGDIYTIGGTGSYLPYSGDGGPATAAELYYAFNNNDVPVPGTLAGTAVDASGNILIADTGNGRVRVLAKSTGAFYGQNMTAGDIYTIADLGPNKVTSVAVDAAGNAIAGQYVIAVHSGLYYGREMVAGNTYNLGVSPSGVVTTQVDHQGNLLLSTYQLSSDRDGDPYGSVQVFAVKTGRFYGIAMTADKVYTVAGFNPASGEVCGVAGGTPALKATLCGPVDAIQDTAGNLVLSDAWGAEVDVLAEKTGTLYGQAMKAGDIYPIAGVGLAGNGGNGGPAVHAVLDLPESVALDGSGNLAIADSRNNEIRVVAEKTGTFYGVAMKAGDIYRVAGSGKAAFGGDGGSALSAWIDAPTGVTASPSGGLLITDDNRVRQIS